jgi:hypothetical protein
MQIKKWRKPDVKVGDYAIWYGPDGKEGDYATEVDGEYVRQYTRITDLIDEPDGEYLCVETYLDPCPKDIRMRAAMGADQIAKYGGEESFADELPQ